MAFLVLFGNPSGFNAAEAKPSTVPYQGYRYVRCNPSGPGVDCPINFPALLPNHRLELSHVSCYVFGGGEIALDFVQLIIVNAQNLPLAAVTITKTGEAVKADPMNNTVSFSALADTSVYAAPGMHVQVDARSLVGFIATFACNLDGHYLTLS